MAEETAISWCDATLNLWWGCTKVSDGCKFCYAEHLADHRYNKGNWGPTGVRKEVKSWRSILNKISKQAKTEGRRLRVFCQSMSDTFEGAETMGGATSENWVTVQRLQNELFDAISANEHLDFLVLTKRPQNVKNALVRCGRGFQDLPSNFWIGTSVEDQKTADERIPHLLEIPAAVRFLSCEPLLGPIDLNRIVVEKGEDPDGDDDEIIHVFESCSGEFGVHWVIAGGESGPNARPMHPDWPRSLRDQCAAAGVAFHFKQWGEWKDGSTQGKTTHVVFDDGDHCLFDKETCERKSAERSERWSANRPAAMSKVGAKASGRLLDDVTHDAFPVGDGRNLDRGRE